MKKWICLLFAILMSLSAACAEEPPVYLALGDSITAGYGLSDDEPCFAEIVALEGGYTLINRAVNGRRVPDILAQLADPAVLADVARADVITITCGGNDLLAVLYERTAHIYNASVPAEMAVSAGEVEWILGIGGDSRQGSLLLAVMIAMEGHADMGFAPLMQSEEMAQALTDYTQNMTTLITLLRSANPDVRIILTTQYNPYPSFSGLYASLKTTMEAGACGMNGAIYAFAPGLNCEIADVYTAISTAQGKLTNASMNPLNLDFHPNAAGHVVIAQCVLALLQSAE